MLKEHSAIFYLIFFPIIFRAAMNKYVVAVQTLTET